MTAPDTILYGVTAAGTRLYGVTAPGTSLYDVTDTDLMRHMVRCAT